MTDNNRVDQCLDKIKERLGNVEKEVTGIKLHLENVTDRDIRILSESHSNLNRKLAENNRITTQQETYQIKVNRLSEDMVIVKKDIADLKNASA